MFALELFFESQLTEYVKKIWKDFYDLEISLAMQSIADLRPHITIAVYDDIEDLNRYFDLLQQFMKHKKTFDIKFDTLAAFPTSGTYFLAPTITNTLISLHKEYYRLFETFNSEARSYYFPDNWNPHCSLAIRLTKDELVKAIAYCLEDFRPIQSRVESIGLVEITFSDGEHKSPTIKELSFS